MFRKFFSLILLALVGFFASCVIPKNTVNAQSSGPIIETYDVTGGGNDYFEARNDAIKQGVVKGIISILGEDKFKRNITKINDNILIPRVMNKISEFHSKDIYNKDGKKYVRALVSVNITALKEELNRLELDKDIQEKPSPLEPSPKNIQKSFSKDVVSQELQEFEVSENSPLRGISILVFCPQEKFSTLSQNEDLKMFINYVNSYLADLGLEYIDFQRSVNLAENFVSIYEEKKGEVMSLGQLLALELKAPVYIEVDIDFNYNFVAGEDVDLDVKGVVKAYESSTGKGLGVFPFSKNIKSRGGIVSTKNKAMVVASRIGLVNVLKRMEEYLSKGIKIEVKVIGVKNVGKEKSFSTFLDSLPGMKGKQRKSLSGDVAIYDVSYSGGVSVFVDDLINAASESSEYSDISIDQSGNSVIVKIK